MRYVKTKLKDLCKIGDGAHASLKRQKSGILYLTAKNITDNGIDLSKVDYISEDIYNKHFKEKSNALTCPQKNDILYSIIGSIGGVYIVGDEKIGISSSVAMFRCMEERIVPQYLYYYIKSPVFHNSVLLIKGGVAQGFMSLSKLGAIEVVYPEDINVQIKIANILSTYTDLIENNQKQIKLLEEAAMRLYKEWFVNLRFPGHESTPLVDGVPEGWTKAEIGSLIDKIPRTKQVMTSEYKNSGSIPIIDQSRNFIAGYTNDEDTVVNLGKPVIVFGDHTRILKLINFPFAKGADGTQLIVSGSERIPQHLFYCSLINVDLSNYHYARHFKYLKACEIIVPNGDLAERFESFVEPYFKQIQNLRDKTKLSQNARNILLPKLMNGEIEV